MELIVCLIGLLFAAYVLGKDNEHRDKLDKLNKEDKILHKLTSCRED